MARKQLSDIVIEGARIIFRNFEGRGEKFNNEGDRNFTVVLEDDALVESLLADGWNVKYLKAREEGENPTAILKVKVSFKGRPPRIVFVTSRGQSAPITEAETFMVDFADMKNVDLIINPFHWDVNGKTGVAAYLKTIYITLNEDELELKYADVPELKRGEDKLAIESGSGPEDLGEMNVLEGEIIETEEAPF